MRHALPSLLLSALSLTAQTPIGSPTPTSRSEALDIDGAFAAALPPPAESRWTLIPWRHSLTDALAEAKASKRPIYLFVNDGEVDSGLC
jgi:hypothetical protein